MEEPEGLTDLKESKNREERLSRGPEIPDSGNEGRGGIDPCNLGGSAWGGRPIRSSSPFPPETTFRDFPSDQPMTDGWSVPEKRKWMLAPLYRDIVLKKGEIDALEGGWHQVANDHLGKGERLFIVP